MVVMQGYSDRRLLTDRGIREAEAMHMLRLEPKLDEKQRQPASIDLKFDYVIESETLPRWTVEQVNTFDNKNALMPKCASMVMTTNSMSFDNVLMPYAELRSSMRRLGCYSRIPAINVAYGLGSFGLDSYSIALEIANYSSMKIKLKKEDRIAQLMVFFDSPPKEALDNGNMYFTPNISREDYKRHLELDHGYEVNSQSELRSLISKGYLSVEPKPVFKKNLIEVHAGKYARVLRKEGDIEFSSRPDARELFEEVELPYKMKAGEFVDVDTVESLGLSKHIGIIFYSEYLFENFFRSADAMHRLRVDSELAWKWDGWIDPGYDGMFSRQPKTYYEKGKLIKPGDVLGYGSVYFFPNGVERQYGSDGLGSQYNKKA